MAELGHSNHEIKPLEPFCAIQIEASASISNLNSVIEGLLCNSLDAGATRIDIAVEHSQARCHVEDDGNGISLVHFREGSGLGLSTFSTRAPSSEVYGRHGRFLALLASLCTLSIVSREPDCRSSGKIVLHNGKTISRQIQASGFAGTRVEVCNLFACLPIRRRQRALHEDPNRSGVDSLTSMILALRLSWPHSAIIRLHLQPSGQTLLFGFSPFTTGIDLRPSSQVLGNRLPQDIINQFLRQSGRSPPSWTSLSAASTSLKLHGVISIKPNSSKNVQFISYGIRPLRQKTDWDEVYIHLNQLFIDSSFGTASDEESLRHSGDHAQAQHYLSKKKPTHECKSHSRWPMFWISIVPTAGEDAYSETLDKFDVGAIVRLLTVAVKQWLVDHKFLKQRSATRSILMPKSSSLPKTVLPPSSGADDTMHIGELAAKKADAQQFDQRDKKQDLSHISKIRTSLAAAPKRPVSSTRTVVTLSGAATEPRRTRKPAEQLNTLPSTEDESTTWTDPITMATMQINHRTGMPCPKPAARRQDPRTDTSQQAAVSSFGPGVTSLLLMKKLPTRVSHGDQENSWLGNVTRNWSKTLFQASELQVRSLTDFLDYSSIKDQLTRTSIRKAKVIAQVDRKFILMKVALSRPGQENGGSKHRPSSEREMLVLVDQHAADERCLVEGLYALMCQAHTEEAGSVTSRPNSSVKPIMGTVTHEEARLLGVRLPRLREFGIEIEFLAPVAKFTAGATMIVRRVPAAVMERCTAEPQLIVNILRREAHAEGTRRTPYASADAGKKHEKHDWLRRIGDCPVGIIEMLHSQACRSAIMFNDELDREKCNALVGRLAECAFPFQCAHGRPSMIPLVELCSVEFGGLYSAEDQGATAGLFSDWDGCKS